LVDNPSSRHKPGRRTGSIHTRCAVATCANAHRENKTTEQVRSLYVPPVGRHASDAVVRCMYPTAHAYLHTLTRQRASVLLNALWTTHQVFLVHSGDVTVRHEDPSSARRAAVNELPALVAVVFVPRHHGFTEPARPVYVLPVAGNPPLTAALGITKSSRGNSSPCGTVIVSRLRSVSVASFGIVLPSEYVMAHRTSSTTGVLPSNTAVSCHMSPTVSFPAHMSRIATIFIFPFRWPGKPNQHLEATAKRRASNCCWAIEQTAYSNARGKKQLLYPYSRFAILRTHNGQGHRLFRK